MLPGSLRKKFRERTTFEEFIFYAFGMGVAIKVRARPYLVFSFFLSLVADVGEED